MNPTLSDASPLIVLALPSLHLTRPPHVKVVPESKMLRW